jgi:hypothetical protein
VSSLPRWLLLGFVIWANVSMACRVVIVLTVVANLLRAWIGRFKKKVKYR